VETLPYFPPSSLFPYN